MTSEVRVGVLFFLGLGLAVWFTFFVTGIGRPKGTFVVRFVRVAQLKDGDPVTYNGVRVGTVATVEPDLDPSGKPLVKVSFAIDKKVRERVLVDTSTHYRIGSGLLGGAFLELVSQSGQPISAEALREVVGETPVAIADAVNSVYSLIEENRKSINDTMLALKEGIQQFSGMVKDNREQVGKTVKSIGDMAANIEKLVVDNRDKIQQMIVHIDLATKQAAEMVVENRADLRQAMEKLPLMVGNIADAAKRIETMIADNSGDVRTAIEKLAAFAPKLDEIGENLRIITRQVAEGKGSVGKVVFQDTLHDKAIQAVDNLNQRLEEVKPFTSGFSDLKLFAGIDGGTNIDSGSSTGTAYLRIEPRPWKYYLGGVSYRTAPEDRDTQRDDPDKLGIDFDLELGWRFIPDDRWEMYRLTVAGGIIESKIGGRIIVPLWKDELSLHCMVRQKDNDRDVLDRHYEDGKALARVTVQWRPFQRWGIYLVGGGDDLLDDPGAWVGLRAELLDNDLRNLTTITGLKP